MANRTIHTLVLSILTLLAVSGCSSEPDTEAIARAVAAESEVLKAEIRADVQNQISERDERLLKDVDMSLGELEDDFATRLDVSSVNTKMAVSADVDQALAGIYSDLDARDANLYGEVQKRIDGIDSRISRRFEAANELLAQKYQEALDIQTDVFLDADAETRQMVDESTELMKNLMLEGFDAQRVRIRELLNDEADASTDRLQEIVDDVYSQLYATDDRVTVLSADLVHAVCEVDYWLNSTRYALWFGILSDEVDLESAKGLFDGMAINDDYAEISGVCAVSEDGTRWELQQ